MGEKVKIVPAVCPNCGAKLKVDPSQDAAICEYCGTPFIVEKAIVNKSYHISNKTTKNYYKTSEGEKAKWDAILLLGLMLIAVFMLLLLNFGII